MKKSQNISIYLKTALFLILIISFQTNLLAQPSPLWGDLKPGKYAAGFKTIEKYDYSRTFRSRHGYFGEIIPGENARPIQICLWYPTQKTDDATYLVLGEYAFPYPENPDFFQIITATQQRELQRLGGMLGNNRGLMLDASNIEMGAVRDAAPAEGKFPLLIYFPGLMSGISDNFVLCEYLASHGFVVMTTHMVGTTGLNPGLNQIDFETVVRDKEFALANIRDLDFINSDKIGTFGVGGGGLAAVLLQMRNFNIEAVASLAGWNIRADRNELVSQNQHYVINRMTKPLLQVYYKNEELFNLDLIDSVKYSDRYIVKLADAPTGGFTSYSSIQSFMDTLNAAKTISRPSYNLTCEYILEFYNLFLKNEDIELTFTTDKADPVDFEFKKAMEQPPTSDQFVGIVQSQGGQSAVELYNKFNQSDSGSIIFPQAVINMAAYQSLQRGQNDDAVALFKLNAETFPNSANCWDSYSDGLQAVGDTAKAIECYKRVLEVLPTDSLVNDQFRTTLKNLADSGLIRLSVGNN